MVDKLIALFALQVKWDHMHTFAQKTYRISLSQMLVCPHTQFQVDVPMLSLLSPDIYFQTCMQPVTNDKLPIQAEILFSCVFQPEYFSQLPRFRVHKTVKSESYVLFSPKVEHHRHPQPSIAPAWVLPR